MKKIVLAVSLLIMSGLAFGQSWYNQDREISGQHYGQRNALRSGTAMEVIVVAVRPVLIRKRGMQGAASYAITGGSAALGAAAFSNIGSGNGKKAATLIGGLLGAAVGAAATGDYEVEGQEVVIKKEGGSKMLAVVQAGSDLRPGMRAIAVEMGGEIRVSPMAAPIDSTPETPVVYFQ